MAEARTVEEDDSINSVLKDEGRAKIASKTMQAALIFDCLDIDRRRAVRLHCCVK
jgi:hypothetical protein